MVEGMSTAEGTYFWEKDFCIPSKTEAGHAILDGVLLQLQDFEWGQKDSFAIQLAFEEALVNAIRHGNQSNNRLGVKVHLEITPGRFLARISDEGPGFDPDNLPDPTLEDFLERPCGRGVKLMRSFMTSVEFNPLGNAVTLEKVRTEPVPAHFLSTGFVVAESIPGETSAASEPAETEVSESVPVEAEVSESVSAEVEISESAPAEAEASESVPAEVLANGLGGNDWEHTEDLDENSAL